MAEATHAPAPDRKVTEEEAENIRSELLHAVHQQRLPSYRSQPVNLSIPDLAEEQVSDISEQMEYFSLLRTAATEEATGMPAAVWPDIGPVPINALGSLPQDELVAIFDAEKPLRVNEIITNMESLTHSYGLGFDLMEPDYAEQILVDGATHAIAERVEIMRGAQQYSGKKYDDYINKEEKGLLVIVHTQTAGLEIIYSAIYETRYGQRFGGTLSSPVESYLSPGTYRFGAVLHSPEFEHFGHKIPPNFEIEMRL